MAKYFAEPLREVWVLYVPILTCEKVLALLHAVFWKYRSVQKEEMRVKKMQGNTSTQIGNWKVSSCHQTVVTEMGGYQTYMSNISLVNLGCLDPKWKENGCCKEDLPSNIRNPESS